MEGHKCKPSRVRADEEKTTTTDPYVLINRHTYTYGILEGIGVCVGVPAKRGQTQNTTGTAPPQKAVNCYLRSAAYRVAPIRFRVGER